jgi:hypothetical protein
MDTPLCGASGNEACHARSGDPEEVDWVRSFCGYAGRRPERIPMFVHTTRQTAFGKTSSHRSARWRLAIVASWKSGSGRKCVGLSSQRPNDKSNDSGDNGDSHANQECGRSPRILLLVFHESILTQNGRDCPGRHLVSGRPRTETITHLNRRPRTDRVATPPSRLPILDKLGMHLTQVAPADGGLQRSHLEGLAMWA